MPATLIAPERTCSDRRAAANRRNACRSTGPRTPQGKARASLNAVKTGCFARTPLLPGEEPAELEAFVADLIDDLSPATAVERDLAERVAGLSWRRRRLWRAEEEVISKEFGPPMDDEDAEQLEEELEEAACDSDQHRADTDLQSKLEGQEFLAEQFAHREPGPLVRIADHERRLSGSIDAALRMLLKLQDRRRKAGGDESDDLAPAPIELTGGRKAPIAPARRAEFPPHGYSASAPNEPTEGESPLLTAARRAGLPPGCEDASAAPNEPNAAGARRGAQSSGLALKVDAQPKLAARNEPIAMGDAAPAAPNEPTASAAPQHAVAQNEAITAPGLPSVDWTAVVASAVGAVSAGRGGNYAGANAGIRGGAALAPAWIPTR